MKTTTISLLAGLTLVTAAQAGESYSPKGKTIIAPPPAPSCLWTWFAGGSYGKMDADHWDEDIYTLHLGIERTCVSNPCGSHAFFLEVGYTEKDEDLFIPTSTNLTNGFDQYGNIDMEWEIIPITLNYKFECNLTGNLNWYVGAGAGIALVDFEASSSYDNVDFDDTVFYAHIFAGLTYNVSESFEIYAGARYVIMDNPDLSGTVYDEVADLDGGIHYELGARFNF
ncbi:outer membrane beta-barrel protein [Verrucomicrobiaceae bacterium R5-34]|uniref:Outer membrane beta-barrel protein n=1 Tax=Oceaniferula flava TaxID=2800421 RepID=A0AAE2SFX4_9BACT|nr:outer membrane beta-barrel protein [Oceaniferula flavus]MBK1832135.1 outer membrane beta-barrel protein [Verrucomicrobiaceae bacterium R5-34]MBK1856247.1 outer membrane beta-barrel protein [Oceaniferula flavus]MBM1137554.1 outer membrane beta-barrel protein [Oceaniferula flavus]